MVGRYAVLSVTVAAFAVIPAPSQADLFLGSGEAVQLMAAAGVAESGPKVAAVLADGCGWVAPVDAPVVDPFRPPAHRYGPGNRGLEYRTEQGQQVVAVANGEVGFVGPVGGTTYVVIHHRDGLRSTYGPLSSTLVLSGSQVLAHQPIAGAAPAMHLTARMGDH